MHIVIGNNNIYWSVGLLITLSPELAAKNGIVYLKA